MTQTNFLQIKFCMVTHGQQACAGLLPVSRPQISLLNDIHFNFLLAILIGLNDLMKR